MGIREPRHRLPIVDLAPPTRTRKLLQRAPGDVPQPRLVVWEFTSACDQRCVHCGPRSGKRRPDELGTDEALRLVDDLADAGVGEVTLIGGEAYLRPDVFLVIRKIRERGMTATMTTGGYNLTRELAERLVEAGIQSVSVSIDGLAAGHDALRQNGQFRARLHRAPQPARGRLEDLRQHPAQRPHPARSGGAARAARARGDPRLADPGDHGPRRRRGPPRDPAPAVSDARAVRRPRTDRRALRTARDHPLPRQQPRLLRPARAPIAADHLHARALLRLSGRDLGRRDLEPRRHQGLPEPRRGGHRRLVARARLCRPVAARPRAHLHPHADGRRTVGLLRDLLLREDLHGRLHVDQRAPPRPAGQQPHVSPPRARARPQRPPRAPRARAVRPRPALRPRPLSPRVRIQRSRAARAPRPGADRRTTALADRRAPRTRHPALDEALRRRPELAPVAPKLLPDGRLFGRALAYSRQLDAAPLDTAWTTLDADVAVFHGEFDYVCTRDEAARIVALVNRHGCRRARLLDLPRVGHQLYAHDSLHAAFTAPEVGSTDNGLPEATLEWLRRAFA